MKELLTALTKAQGQVVPVAKKATNPHFKSKYATLDDIIDMLRPILSENSLAIVQQPVFNEHGAGVVTVIHHAEGQSLDCGELILPIGRGGGAQGAGSSITYARRYALSAIFNIATEEDDDGNGAQSAKPNPEITAIRKLLKDHADKHGTDAAMEILKNLGVKKAADLPEGSLTKVKEMCNE